MHEVPDLAYLLYRETAVFAILAVVGGLFGFFVNIRKCLDKQSARTLKIMKAMQLLAREIDKQTNRDHKDAYSTLETNIDTILKDSKGDL